MLKNNLLPLLLGGLLCMPAFVVAHDGVINFTGRAVEATCTVLGVAKDGEAPEINATIKLPEVSVDELGEGSAGTTSFVFHFRGCSSIAGHRSVGVMFSTTNTSADGGLYMPDRTPDSAENVGFKIYSYGTYVSKPNTLPSVMRAIPQVDYPGVSGDFTSEYSVVYQKVQSGVAVKPGKMSTTVTYQMIYY